MIALLASLLLATGVTVVLPAEAKVAGTELSLGAVATVQCDDAALAARVAALELGYAPAPGYSRVLEAGALLRQVRALAPGVDVRIAGAGTCRVLPLSELVSAATIAAAARASLEAHVAGLGLGDCTVEPAAAGELAQSFPASFEVPKGKSACALEVAPLAFDGRSPVQVAVRLVVDGQPYRTAYTSWNVRAWRTQPVLVRGVRAGEALDAAAFEMRRAPLEASLSQPALEPAQVVGTTAARELPAGRALCASDLVRPIVVQRGDALTLVVRSGAVHVRTTAIASTAGAAGDRVRVVIQSNGRELEAVVEGRGLAKVDLGRRSIQGVR